MTTHGGPSVMPTVDRTEAPRRETWISAVALGLLWLGVHLWNHYLLEVVHPRNFLTWDLWLVLSQVAVLLVFAWRARPSRRLLTGALVLVFIVLQQIPLLVFNAFEVSWSVIHSFAWLFDLIGYLGAIALVAAWGVGRRQGWVWLLGLLAVIPAYWIAQRAIIELLSSHHTSGFSFADQLTPLAMLACGLLCWLIDVASRSRLEPTPTPTPWG